MIYNFRFDRTNVERRNEVLRRVKEDKLLAQGWGGGIGEVNLNINGDNHIKECFNFFQLKSTRIPRNLQRIKDFKNGDIIITPHLPEDGKLSIHIVDGDFNECYIYKDEDDNYLNNNVKIKKSYGLEGNISIDNYLLTSWRGKLQWLRLPVLPMPQYENVFRKLIIDLDDNPKVFFPKSSLNEYLENIVEKLLNEVKQELRQINSNNSEISFEAVCEYILLQEGYRIDKRNDYDGQGGDIDLACSRKLSDYSAFELGDYSLYVQVKKHSGETGHEAVEQLLKMMENELHANGCIMSLADSFSEEAIKKADDNGIVLMNGNSICRLMIKSLFKV